MLGLSPHASYPKLALDGLDPGFQIRVVDLEILEESLGVDAQEVLDEVQSRVARDD